MELQTKRQEEVHTRQACNVMGHVKLDVVSAGNVALLFPSFPCVRGQEISEQPFASLKPVYCLLSPEAAIQGTPFVSKRQSNPACGNVSHLRTREGTDFLHSFISFEALTKPNQSTPCHARAHESSSSSRSLARNHLSYLKRASQEHSTSCSNLMPCVISADWQLLLWHRGCRIIVVDKLRHGSLPTRHLPKAS